MTEAKLLLLAWAITAVSIGLLAMCVWPMVLAWRYRVRLQRWLRSSVVRPWLMLVPALGVCAWLWVTQPDAVALFLLVVLVFGMLFVSIAAMGSRAKRRR